MITCLFFFFLSKGLNLLHVLYVPKERFHLPRGRLAVLPQKVEMFHVLQGCHQQLTLEELDKETGVIALSPREDSFESRQD